MKVIRSYEGEFGSFEIDIYNGEILLDNIDRDKIWEYAEIKPETPGIDAYKIQKYVYSRILSEIFTEDLIEYRIEWDWNFVDFGVEYEIDTPAKKYVLVVDAEGSFVYEKIIGSVENEDVRELLEAAFEDTDKEDLVNYIIINKNFNIGGVK